MNDTVLMRVIHRIAHFFEEAKRVVQRQPVVAGMVRQPLSADVLHREVQLAPGNTAVEYLSYVGVLKATNQFNFTFESSSVLGSREFALQQ